MKVPAPDPASVEAADIERLLYDARRDDDERHLCRLWLQANVVSVSRLALDVAREAGIDLNDACEVIVPAMAFRWRSVRTGRPFHARIAHARSRKGMMATTAWPIDNLLVRRARRQGALFGDLFSTEGWTGFAVGSSVLEVAGRIKGCWFGSCRGQAWLTLPQGFPETLATALPGRPLDTVVSHGAFNGRGYRISRVDDLDDGCRVMVFRTGVEAFEMPWSQLLADVMARGQ